MALGNKIQRLREECSLSQKELAGLVGVTTGVIAEWEADETAPGLTELARLSKALGVSSDVLLDATAEDVVAPMATHREEPAVTVTKVKKSKKAVWIIGAAVAVALLAVAAFFLFRNVPFADDASAIEKADASVVTIFCYDYEGELATTGSGFVAFDGKTIITNYHVMTSAFTCKISTNQDISYEVTGILCYSKKQDIAILELAEDTGLQPLTLGDSSLIKKGETVVAIGSPLGIKNTVSTGVLSGRLMEDNMDVLQFTAPISSGSSGGALFDNNGNVIGITYASYIDGQNLNLAIPVELASDLYNSKKITKEANAICVAEYPYITKLIKYEGLPEITIDELLENPENYNGKSVKVYGYLSSTYSYGSRYAKYHENAKNWDGSETATYYLADVLYIASEANVTGNGAVDHDMYSKAEKGRIRHQLLEADFGLDYRFYWCGSKSPGDLICWIGEIRFWIDASGNVFLYGLTDLCYRIS